MVRRLHPDEVPIDLGTVRSLLAAQLPALASSRLTPIEGAGTSNVLWRVTRADGDLVVRLPRNQGAASSLRSEVEVLTGLAGTPLPVAVPVVHHLGHPAGGYPHPWAVLGWLDGVDAWEASRGRPGAGRAGATPCDRLATDLAATVMALRAVDGIAAPRRRPGRRGGPIHPLLDTLDRWLDDPAAPAAALVDVAAVRRLAAEARQLPDTVVPGCFVHGDLLPANLLVDAGRLRAVIDWGAAGLADPAQDLAPAWSVLDARGRSIFREAVGADDEAWLRGRAFELEHAVGGILYYTPRRHPLADIMARTLEQVLADG